MEKIKYYIAMLVSIIFSSILSGQDIHFSQYNNTPLFLNPANSGAINSDYRAILNYKNQWSSINNAYETYSFSYDRSFFKKEIHGGYLGAGLNFMRDVSGEVRLSTTNASLSLSYHVPINRDQYLSSAIQLGTIQHSIDKNKFRWDNQYVLNNGFDQTLSSGEIINFEDVLVGDVSGGILWNYSTKESYLSANNATIINLGIAGFHLNRPFISFYGGSSDRLMSRYALFGDAHIGISNSNFAIMPSALLMLQGQHKEIIAGSLFKYTIQEQSKYTRYNTNTSFAIGGSYRFKDAIILQSNFEITDFIIGLSYDINISRLRIASYGRGGIELSVCYKGFKKRSICKF